MYLDPTTLVTINAANQLLLALVLPVIMGQQLSPAARDARRSLIVQAVGWVALIASGYWPEQWPDRVLSTVSMTCIGLSQWLMFKALQSWLGRRPLARLLTVATVLLPIGYGLGFEHYAFRVGWANGWLALQLAIVARATLWPRSNLGGPWRWVLGGCMATMTVFTLGRGILGAFLTDQYPSFLAPHPVNIGALLVVNISQILGNVAVLVGWREEAEAELRRLAMTDRLTGVLNRHGWNRFALPAFDHARRHQQPLALLAIDIDHFKRVNDERGHEAGDHALALLGQLLRECQRSSDMVARLGGEEFCVLLPMADADAARRFDQRLRERLTLAAPRELGHPLNYSAGLAVLDATDLHIDTLLARADAALYEAKHRGRGQLVTAPTPSPQNQ